MEQGNYAVQERGRLLLQIAELQAALVAERTTVAALTEANVELREAVADLNAQVADLQRREAELSARIARANGCI